MGVSNLKLLKPKNRAKVIQTFGEIQSFIAEIYGDIPDKSELKYLTSFIELVCCAIEEAYSKPTIENKKVSKKDEAFNQISKFLNIKLTEDDKKFIGNIIEDLHSSRRIKKVSYLQRTVFLLAKFFLKKD
jgi:hypothetical protein